MLMLVLFGRLRERDQFLGLTGTSPLECIVVVCGRHDEFLKARSGCIMHHQYYIVVVGKKLNYHLFTSASDISPYWDEAK